MGVQLGGKVWAGSRGCGCGAGTSGVVRVHPAGDGACFFYDGHSHPFLRLRDGTHRWPVRPVNPASSPGQADQAGTAGRCHINLGPADRTSRRTARTASAESEVRPGPSLPTLRPCSVKIREAGPEVLSTLSLPTRYSANDCLAAVAALDPLIAILHRRAAALVVAGCHRPSSMPLGTGRRRSGRAPVRRPPYPRPPGGHSRDRFSPPGRISRRARSPCRAPYRPGPRPVRPP